MERDVLEALGRRSPFYRQLGTRLGEVGAGRAELQMDVEHFCLNAEGVVHGGILAALADQAAMRAVQTVLEEGRISRTAQMDVHYLAPAEGKRLRAVGRVLKTGRSVAFSEAWVEDEGGRTVAVARCTIMILEARNNDEPGGLAR